MEDTWLERRAVPQHQPKAGSGFSPQVPLGTLPWLASPSTLAAVPRGSSMFKQPHLPGCVSAPRTCDGTSTQVNEVGRSPEPARTRERSEKTVLVEIPVLWGPTRLCCEPCRGDLLQSAMSLWQHATGIQGGDSSWQGVPWSGTSHNLPWRRPQCVCHRQRCPRGPHHL